MSGIAPYRSFAALAKDALDGVVRAKCPKCGATREVEPDAENYPCWTQGCAGKITSPAVKAGIV